MTQQDKTQIDDDFDARFYKSFVDSKEIGEGIKTAKKHHFGFQDDKTMKANDIKDTNSDAKIVSATTNVKSINDLIKDGHLIDKATYANPEKEGYIRLTLQDGVCVIDCESSYINDLYQRIFFGVENSKLTKSIKWDKVIFIDSCIEIINALELKKINANDTKEECMDYILFFFGYDASRQEKRLFLNGTRTFLEKMLPEQIYVSIEPTFSANKDVYASFFWRKTFTEESATLKKFNYKDSYDLAVHNASDDDSDINESEIDTNETMKDD